MTTLGAIALPRNPPELLRDIARTADRAGLEELWLWEDCFLSGGISATAAALAWTDNLRVGIGIMPVPFRNVAACAMEIATLCRMFGDRAMPGIGHGVQDWMGQVGARPASPLTLFREYAAALRSLLHGDSVTTQGRYVNLDAVRLDWPPAQPPKIYVGATGPKTLALAGEVGDGTILTGGTSPAGVAKARGHIAATGPHELVVFVPAAFGPDGASRLAEQQRAEKTDVPGVSGSPAEMAEALREYVAAGATRLILQPAFDEPDPAGFVARVTELRPLLD
ncbi:LLM class flavin-dependent oxidoreductase [Paractinoplanes rishiriensis]|uniref:Oxidoreductase n=1 Tax=Paractinoplanes rishiriensis TaxID=1050105 RepID=A0A919K6J3_9ACTN|nr:LLM class flavin-dependent oxidoreductase [Actinoplanes rishiriensis]GIF00278.1 oxidoreductase [Actinoplanes rishiriensis]